MSSRQKLTIVDVIERSGVSQKTGRPYSMHTAQCILQQVTSEGEQLLVGTISLPEKLKDARPGDYLAEFALSQSREGELVPRLVSLSPTGNHRPQPKADAKAAA
jgi:hypothetical protein